MSDSVLKIRHVVQEADLEYILEKKIGDRKQVRERIFSILKSVCLASNLLSAVLEGEIYCEEQEIENVECVFERKVVENLH
jgi:hypothetical protein